MSETRDVSDIKYIVPFPIQTNKVINMKHMHKLTYQQTAWNDVWCPTNMREFTLLHNVQRQSAN